MRISGPVAFPVLRRVAPREALPGTLAAMGPGGGGSTEILAVSAVTGSGRLREALTGVAYQRLAGLPAKVPVTTRGRHRRALAMALEEASRR